MASFPKSESEITTLAEFLASGLTNHSDLFPSPPVIPVDLNQTLAAFQTAATAALEASAAAETATAEKLAALEMLVSNVKCDLRYAENQSGGADDQLKLLGWGGKKPPTPLAPPSHRCSLPWSSRARGGSTFAGRPPCWAGRWPPIR